MAKKSPKTTLSAQDSAPPADANDLPRSNLMLADIVMRMGTGIVRHGVEAIFLRGRYGKETAKDLTKNRSMGRTLASTAIAKVGSKSLPGAALVTGGLVIKLLFDRSKARQDARRDAGKQARLPTKD